MKSKSRTLNASNESEPSCVKPHAEAGGIGRVDDADREAGADELTQTRERIAELEAELSAAQETVSALLDKAEHRVATTDAQDEALEALSRVDLVAKRTAEVEEKSRLLADVNSELRALTKNLDQIVRARTRALTESEAQLREKMEELQRLNTMKGEFISIAAHELRTPLTSIVGYHDLMLEGRFGELPEKMKRPMQSLRRNSERLRRLVDEMLDISRIEAGKVRLFLAACNLGEVVRHVVDDLRPLAHEKQQSLSISLGALPELQADSDKLHQVVTNLLSNAIRYTPIGGSIEVFTDLAPEETHAGAWVRLRVRDNGVGIPLELRARIFEPFSDVNTAKHHTSSGPDSAGLGLYIARALVDLHGGIISVDSEEDQFTEFTVLLPSSRGPDVAR